jgi:hypothetical protein
MVMATHHRPSTRAVPRNADQVENYTAVQALPASIVSPSIGTEVLLAQRVTALERAAANQQTAAPAPSLDAREVEAMHDAHVAQHAREAVSESWARTTASIVREDFEITGPNAYQVSGVECRSSTCVLDLTWQSRALALSGWQDALRRPSRLPCAREIVVPTSAGEDGGAASAQLLLDCSTWVAQGAQL